MNLTHLKTFNFRNLRSISLEPKPALNLFIGDNGQGKTNLLDAIAIGAQVRPVRAVRQNSDLILFGEQQARIEAVFEDESTLSVSVTLDHDGKIVRLNNKPTRDPHALREKIALVSFVPEDLGAVMGGAGLRRRLLDQITASLYPSYALYYRQYEKVLLQRNKLLKLPLVDLIELESFTSVLSQIASSIEKGRLLALDLIRPYYQEAVSRLSNNQLSS